MLDPRAECEDLVLLHGFAGTRRTWDGVLAHLDRERYRPLALDLPGHGELSGAPDPIDLESCVASVLERSPRRFALCGYSMGGRIALHIAMLAPERLSRLILIAGGPGIHDRDERAERRGADRALAEQIAAGSIEDFLARWCAQPMFAEDPPQVQALGREDYRRNDPVSLAAALRGLGPGELPSLWTSLPELATPVAIVAGDRDEKFQDIAWKMVEGMAGGRLRTIVGGHRLPLESPRAVAAAICSQ